MTPIRGTGTNFYYGLGLIRMQPLLPLQGTGMNKFIYRIQVQINYGFGWIRILPLLCPFCHILSTLCSQVVFTMYRISLADGKRAGQKVHRKIAVAVQNVKHFYFLSRSFEI